MKEIAESEERIQGNGSAIIPEAGVPCPVSAMLPGTEALNSGVCLTLENSGCPLARETQRRLEFETLLTELSSRFVNVPAAEVDSQIERGMRRIVELLEIDRCGFGEVSADGKQFLVTHSYQLPTVPSCLGFVLQTQFPVYARMVRQGMVVRLPEDLPPGAVLEREYLRQSGLKSSLTIPLTVLGSVVGAIGLASFRSHLAWSDELLNRLRLVGDIFTNALVRKRADEALCAKEISLRQSQEGLRQLTARLLQAQEEERRRIAREMHDDWTQRLASLGIEVARLERQFDVPEVGLPLLHSIQQQLISLSEDVHALSRQLHPSILDDLGLVEALRSECAAFVRREGIEVDYSPDELPATVPSDVALCLYRVSQEALRNVAKHAAAVEVAVTLSVLGPDIVLRIEDRGVGFDPENERNQPGLGLSSMTERVALIQGQISVASTVGRGTTVEVCGPVDGMDSMTRARVLIADDHQILAEGIRSLLEPEFEVVAVVSDGRQLVAAAKEHLPDAIVADISMPSLNGIEAAALIRSAGLSARVVFLTMHRDVAYARRALEAGAVGFVLKHSVSSELVTAIREALQGKTYITPLIAGELLQSYRGGEARSSDSTARLTARQREVLQLVAEGRSAKEIAAALQISVRTAEAHKARILESLGLQGTAELVQFAIRSGLISIE